MLETELMTTADHGLSADRIKIIDMLTHSIKSIDTILAMRDTGYANTYRPQYSYGDRSYRYDGYSRSDGDIRARLTDMMHNAGSEQEREALRRCIEQM